MKIDDIAKQLANKVNQEHYIKHYLEKVQRGAYNKGVKDAEAKQLILSGVSVLLPSVDDAGIIAVEIAEINNEMTAQEQAFFIAGFSECIKYLEIQSNER